jgi:hypothetical protein
MRRKFNFECPALNLSQGQRPLDPDATTVLPMKDLAIVCCILFGIAMMPRIFTSAYLINEDIMMVLSIIGFAVLVGLTLSGAKYGLGRHQWNVTVVDLNQTL